MFIFVIVLSVIVQGLVALFVFQKNPRSLTNSLFFLLSFFVTVWATINFVITRDPFSSSQLILYRFLMASVVVQNIFFYLFAHTYPDRTIKVNSKHLKLYAVLSVAALIATLTPLVFVKVTYGPGGARPVTGPGMLLFGLHAAVSVISGLRKIYHRYAKESGVIKRQFQMIFIGSIILWGVVPITNFVIPLATQTLFFSKISPIYTLAFSSVIAYAIVAQKLFDIRAAVTRSVGYLLIVAAMVVTYGVGLFGVIDVLVRGANHEMLRQVLSLILVTPLALSFQRIRNYFDKVTTRLFYRDAYDTQEVLDQLGTVATSEIELYKLLAGTRRILTSTLKCSFVEFVLIKNDKAYFEARTHKTIAQNLLSLGKQITQQTRELLVSDEMTGQLELREQFREANVAVSLRLKTHEQVVGYIIFGDKRGGDIYSAQDKKLMLIVANELSIAVQNALRFEEIQNFNLTLQARVEEATRRARRVNERLKQLDETKDDFVSMASHQLRTPLTSVKGYISMVLEGDAGKLNATQRQLLEQSFVSSQRMVYLIADLLNVSRLKTGKFIIDPTPVNIADIVEQELSQLTETAQSRKLTLTFNKPEQFPSLMLDETKTRQVIMNFADNAIYYTPAGGHIEVKLIETAASVELRVIDDGIGVPKSEQHHLFSKFYRAGNARKARPDGTGLGLFMAKKVIVAEGGALIFETQEGKGSTFGFVFSKTKLAPKDIPEPMATGTVATKRLAKVN